MTVAELIEALKQFPQDAQVVAGLSVDGYPLIITSAKMAAITETREGYLFRAADDMPGSQFDAVELGAYD